VKGMTIGKYYCTIGMIVLNYSAIFVPAVEEEKVSPLEDIIPIRRRVF